MSETETRQAEGRPTGGESTGGDEIEMSVVKVGSLPEKFRPSPSGRVPATEDVPGPIAELIREATSGLTGPEREVFLRRLKEEHPGLFLRESADYRTVFRTPAKTQEGRCSRPLERRRCGEPITEPRVPDCR